VFQQSKKECCIFKHCGWFHVFYFGLALTILAKEGMLHIAYSLATIGISFILIRMKDFIRRILVLMECPSIILTTGSDKYYFPLLSLGRHSAYRRLHQLLYAGIQWRTDLLMAGGYFRCSSTSCLLLGFRVIPGYVFYGEEHLSSIYRLYGPGLEKAAAIVFLGAYTCNGCLPNFIFKFNAF